VSSFPEKVQILEETGKGGFPVPFSIFGDHFHFSYSFFFRLNFINMNELESLRLEAEKLKAIIRVRI